MLTHTFWPAFAACARDRNPRSRIHNPTRVLARVTGSSGTAGVTVHASKDGKSSTKILVDFDCERLTSIVSW